VHDPSINSQDAQSNPDLFKLKSNKKYMKNPLFGYHIKEFVACQPGTEVLRVSHPLFITFLERSVINQWTEKEQLSNLPPEIRLEQLTKK
jgi:hypothetical protein